MSTIQNPQKDRRSGMGVRVCVNEPRPAAGADLTSSLTVRPTGGKAAGPVAHAGTGGTTKTPRRELTTRVPLPTVAPLPSSAAVGTPEPPSLAAQTLALVESWALRTRERT